MPNCADGWMNWKRSSESSRPSRTCGMDRTDCLRRRPGPLSGMQIIPFPFAAAGLLLLATTVSAQGPGGGNQGTPIREGEACPPGMTEFRPRRCMAPQLPAPSILDYRPRSTLVVGEHKVPRAKYPAIDFHGHPQGFASADGLARLGASMDSLNLRVMVVANNVSGDALKAAVQAVAASPKMKDRVRILTGIDFRNVGPGWADKAIAQLRADVAAGGAGLRRAGQGRGRSARAAGGPRRRTVRPALHPASGGCAAPRAPGWSHT